MKWTDSIPEGFSCRHFERIKSFSSSSQKRKIKLNKKLKVRVQFGNPAHHSSDEDGAVVLDSVVLRVHRKSIFIHSSSHYLPKK
jgi:hypothetical protein